MKPTLLTLLGVVSGLAAVPAFSQTAPAKADYALMPAPFKEVQIQDDFWTPRLENNRKVSIPGMFERYGNRPDLRLIEAACYELELKPDPALRTLIDSKLDAEITNIRGREGKWSTAGDGDGLWAGNFLEAAVAHFEATGSRKMLDVAIEVGNDLDASFGPGKRHDISNHEGVELGLLKLYRCTNDARYLKLAQFFIDARGNPDGRPALYGPYAQDQAPIKDQTRAIGHCVRATYLYMPLTEIAALTGDIGYQRADERIWTDAVAKRTFLTGGFGSYRDKEDFADDYDLPNLACWNEICAAYGNTLWNERMFLLSKDSKYADMMEHTLYNALLVGVSLSGDTYLYQAPLKTFGNFARERWYGPNCCPPNVARLLPQLGSLAYSQNDDGVYVNLFLNSTANLKLAGTPAKITQTTQYPWDGNVKISVQPDKAQKFSVLVRIPGWARNEAWPTDLYRYASLSRDGFSLKVNGANADYHIEKGYARVTREWKAGDSIELNLPMPVRRVEANSHVADDRGMVAIQRGPLIYCVEQPENPAGVFNLMLPDNAAFQFSRPMNAASASPLNGIGRITGDAIEIDRAAGGANVEKQPRAFTAIPYYAFGNSGKGDMSVWLARDESRVVLAPKPTIASTSKATSSCENGTVKDNYPGHNPPSFARRLYPNSQDGSGDIAAIYDQIDPMNSEDGSSAFLRLHPQTGNQAWVQYDFAKTEKVSSVELYWKDDRQFCIAPHSWHLLYKDGSEWKPVTTSETYGVAKDKFNKVSFQPVTTSALRIEIELQPKVYKKGELGPPDANYMSGEFTWYEGGVIEWRVNP